MRTRTRLTTPPGQEPELSTTPGRGGDEVHVPALAIPEEPRVPGRHRRSLLVLGLVVLVAAAVYVTFRVSTSGQGFDPALDPGFAPDPAATATPDTPAPTGEG